MKIKVEQGQILVNSIQCIRKGEGFYLFTADCRAKRVEIGAMSGGSEVVVTLETGPETLHTEDSLETTTITFVEDGDWIPEVTFGRYTAYIFLWQRNDNYEEVWTRVEG